MRRDDMVEKFCNQMFDFINSVFTYESIYAEYSKLVELYDYEMQFAMSREVSYTLPRRVARERQYMLDFARNRKDYVIEDMQESFGIPGEFYNVSVIGKTGASVKLNTLGLDGEGTLESCYFTAHSVQLGADINSQQFDYWLINGQKYSEREVILSNHIAQDGHITAELFLK
jgi:hypothetical protein